MYEYNITVLTKQELSDWELDELRQGVVDWMSVDDEDDLSVTVREGD